MPPSAPRSPWPGLVGAPGRALERERKRVVHEAIEDGVGDRGVAQRRVPLIAGQLARDDRRAGRVAILHHLEEILALDVGHRDQAPVIEDQDIDARQPREYGGVRAIGAGERQLLKEARHPPVDGPVALPTGMLAQRDTPDRSSPRRWRR
jgi:hypothetical protein